MKLIVTGSTGFVATEVVRQALLHPSITSVVALARKAIPVPKDVPDSDAAKLNSIVVSDYGTYSDDVKKSMTGAEACIWTVAITPSKAKSQDPAIVRKVCQEWAISGLETMIEVNQDLDHPIRFMYMSGTAARDPAHPRNKDAKAFWPSLMPQWMIDYGNMRGETATKLFNVADETPGRAEICVAKPGLITGKSGLLREAASTIIWATGLLDTVHIKDVSAAMLHHAVNGFEGTDGVLLNAEMVKLGKEIAPA